MDECAYRERIMNAHYPYIQINGIYGLLDDKLVEPITYGSIPIIMVRYNHNPIKSVDLICVNKNKIYAMDIGGCAILCHNMANDKSIDHKIIWAIVEEYLSNPKNIKLYKKY